LKYISRLSTRPLKHHSAAMLSRWTGGRVFKGGGRAATACGGPDDAGPDPRRPNRRGQSKR
jgi:hypothetical protein